MKSKQLIASVLCIFLAALNLNAQKPLTAADSAKYSIYYWHSKDMFENLPDIKGEIIFLGNSITDGCEWFELLGNSKCLNRGISADVTEGVLLRLDAITRVKPAKIFLMIGINDLGRERSVDSVAANYELIIQRIKKETPKTTLYIESILPVNPAKPGKYSHTGKTEQIKELNIKLKSLATKYNCPFVDLFPIMADSQDHLKSEYTLDGLHLTYKGYKAWADYIKPLVK
ncbi:MAG TPA: GDSL-type esterase/lipase family protein [Bacteroidales bacterium]|nr:GDSL-type esterase/lipase family protein [Bacteroidales bacterium]HPT11921.1 GDSL-type esterase/lipase family protein [Bacteroidales bacterium]